MNGHGLLNTSSPKLTVPQVSEQASGAATGTASRLTSRVGRASSSLMCTWTTAAPAASHSLAVTTSSARVTGRAGTAALSASAPVGATVIRVLLLAAMAGPYPRLA